MLHTCHLTVSDLDRRGEAVLPLLPRFGEWLLDLNARAETTLAVGMPASAAFLSISSQGFSGSGNRREAYGGGGRQCCRVVDMAVVDVADTTSWRYSTTQLQIAQSASILIPHPRAIPIRRDVVTDYGTVYSVQKLGKVCKIPVFLYVEHLHAQIPPGTSCVHDRGRHFTLPL